MHMKSLVSAAALALAGLCAMPAHAELVVVVSAKASSPPSIEVVCQAYLGKTKVPEPVNLPEKNALRDEFYSKACHKDPAQVRSIWAKLIFTGNAALPKEADSGGDLKKLVAADPGRVGYLEKKDVDASLKVIASLN
jgi:hypothetical protein